MSTLYFKVGEQVLIRGVNCSAHDGEGEVEFGLRSGETYYDPLAGEDLTAVVNTYYIVGIEEQSALSDTPSRTCFAEASLKKKYPPSETSFTAETLIVSLNNLTTEAA